MASNAKNLAEYLNNETTSATADIADGSITVAKLASSLDLSSKTVTLAAGVGDLDWTESVKTANFTAVAGKGYFVNTTSSAITVTLPSSPSVGNKVAIVDYAGTADTNNITINPAGSDKVEGQTTYNLVISGERTGIECLYKDATQGWLVTSTAKSNETSKVNAAFDNTNPLNSFGEGLQGAATSASSYVKKHSKVTDNSVSAGATSLNVASGTGFAAGQLVIIHNTQEGSSSYYGKYEYQRIASVNSNTLTFTAGLQNSYESNQIANNSESELTQVVRVNEFTNLTLTGENINADSFDGHGGGILALWCSGTLTLAGANISASERGFRGGTTASGSADSDNRTGESVRSYSFNGRTGTGGGGGGGRQNTPGSTPQGAGGGGGHGTAGANGNIGNFGFGGVTIGQQDLRTVAMFGGAGGAGGYDYSNAGGNGGGSGGLIIINAAAIVSTGTSSIVANGGEGGSGSGGGYGGSGAGGAIFINCNTITESSGTFTVTANGGTNGADGGAGRIHIRGTNSGVAVTPTPYTA